MLSLIASKALLAALTLSPVASAGKTQSVSNWGDNPSGLPAMLVYTPDKIAEKPAIILGLHPCGGTGQMYQSMTPLPSYADKLGFVLLYPTSKSQSGMNCWDAHSNKSLTHAGGGDSEGLVGMVTWALKTYNGDPSKVFVVGGSSGAMEANVLAATYPDVFAGAASYSGVPAACWAGSPMSTPMSPDLSCPLGKKAGTYSAKQWGDLARECDPGYEGPRPKMMVVHGTADTAVVISLLKAQLDQWSDVLGVSWAKNVTNDPIANWKKIVYGDGTRLVGYEVQGGGHIPPFQGDATLKFFGLM
ncbi:Carbohydrate esterase family 1 protein [Coniochaeta hoffmannii]|uniref:Carboxylic ester hydrolase n=1 Tax=Coniochaeta hoffmannii TaxID=91930 RepID=A0AA38VDP6_9PEZI|nr:Carbohydrate esterase family 1 protein [Coniochaeta hoffmannii]